MAGWRTTIHRLAWHGRRMVARRGTRDGSLAESLASVHGRIDWCGGQCGLSARGAHWLRAPRLAWHIQEWPLGNAFARVMGRDAGPQQWLAADDDVGHRTGAVDLLHPDLRT